MTTETDPRLGLPSASATWFWQCPGSWNLRNSIPPDQLAAADNNDEFTAMGSRVDKARETGNPLPLSEEEEKLYQNGMKFEAAIVEQWKADVLREEPEAQFVEGPVKQRLWANDPETLEPVVSGESDVHYLTSPVPSHILICDWKLVGRRVSRAESNTQMRILAVLKWRDMDGIQCIRVALNRCLGFGSVNDYCDYREPDLLRSEAWMHQHLWLSRQPDAPLRAGPWCDYCPCKAFCAQAGAYSLLPSVMVQRLDSEVFDAPKQVALLEPADLLKIWKSEAVITKIFKAVKERLKGMSTRELEDLGLKPGKGREMPSIPNPHACFEFLQKEGWGEPEIHDCMKFSLEALSDRAKYLKSLPSDKAAKAWVKETLAQFIRITEAEPPLKEIAP